MDDGILVSGMHCYLIVDHHLVAISPRFGTIRAIFTALLARTESHRGEGWEGKALKELMGDVSVLCEVVTGPLWLSSRLRSEPHSRSLRTDWDSFLCLGHTEDALSPG